MKKPQIKSIYSNQQDMIKNISNQLYEMHQLINKIDKENIRTDLVMKYNNIAMQLKNLSDYMIYAEDMITNKMAN